MPDPAWEYDLVVRADRLVCPATGLDGPGAVAVRDDRIAAAGPAVSGSARRELRVPGGLLLPGLVDFHAHPARSGSKFGVDPDTTMLLRGVTTVLSQGDAGAATLGRYLVETVEASATRVRLALNLASHGEESTEGSLESLADADPEVCAAAVRAGGDAVWGIAVNTSVPSCGTVDPREVLRRALAAAGEAGCPLLVGLRRQADWPLADQLSWLRPGDVVTYCFSPGEEALVQAGRVHPATWEARSRGVRFDLGHGMASFSFSVAEAAAAEGFYPDTISTDFYARHLGQQPPHDLPRVLSKLLAAGLPESEALAAVTARPAAALGLAGEVGSLAPGACADLALLRWNPAAAPLRDTAGELRRARPQGTRAPGCWEPIAVVRAGRVVAAPD